MTDTETRPVPTSIYVSIGVLESEMKNVKDSVDKLTDAITEQNKTNVTRVEWETRNHVVDGKFDDAGREIGDLRKDHAKDVESIRGELRSKQLPWTQYAAVIASFCALGWAVFGPIISGGS